MYTEKNFKTKKALKEAIAKGEKIAVYQPNGDLFNVKVPSAGNVTIEGPHYPAPHSWYATATLAGGYVVKVK